VEKKKSRWGNRLSCKKGKKDERREALAKEVAKSLKQRKNRKKGSCFRIVFLTAKRGEEGGKWGENKEGVRGGEGGGKNPEFRILDRCKIHWGGGF